MKIKPKSSQIKPIELLKKTEKLDQSQDVGNTQKQDINIPQFFPLKADKSRMGEKKLAHLKWSRWYIIKDKRKDVPIKVVKRYAKVEGKVVWQNYNRSEYVGLKESELTAFVTRLNGDRDAALARAKQAFAVRHTFITPALLTKWEKEVLDNQSDEDLAYRIINTNQKNFVHFFIEKLKMTDPLDWYENQALWGKVLLNIKPSEITKSRWEEIRLLPEGGSWASKTIKDIVMFANRFVRFLHKESPRLFPLLVFEPISKAVLKKHEADRKLSNKTRKKHYIKDEDWALICNGDKNRGIEPVSSEILPFIKLGYLLGLRDSEILGADLDNVGTEHFDLEKQLISIPEGKPLYGPPKSRKTREIPYWNTSPKEIYLIIKSIQKLMHPDTLIHKFSAEMARLRLPYRMHDLRRTWITRCLHSGIDLIKVKEAAGHAQISTTNLYLLSPGSIKNKRYKPED